MGVEKRQPNLYEWQVVKHFQGEVDPQPTRETTGVAKPTRQKLLLGCENLVSSFYKTK